MIWPYRRTGSPAAIGLIATLWPAGIRSTVVTPSATTMPGGRLERAISTPSSGCRRMTGAGVMGASFVASPPLRRGRIAFDQPLPARAVEREKTKSRLAAGFFPRLVDLHPCVGRHQSNFIRERHELEAHIDGAYRGVGAAAVNAWV